MKHRVPLTLLLFCCIAFPLFAQESNVDSNLLRTILSGHQLLSQYTLHFSGRIECQCGDADTDQVEYSGSRKFLFFKDKDLLRLEYIAPQEGTEIYAGHPKNDITEVRLKSKEHFFQYWAVPSTGVPYANLMKAKGVNESAQMTLDADFYTNVNALTTFPNSPGTTVIDLLSSQIGSIEKRPWGSIADALWIKTNYTDNDGTTASWEIVLNPQQHYALLSYGMQTVNSKTGFTVISSGIVSSQKTEDGKIFPKEIIGKGFSKIPYDNETQVIYTKSHTKVTIFSTDKPDAKLFTEESFKDLGRDYVVVDVLSNGKTAKGGRSVMAAPEEARRPYFPTGDFPAPAWSWQRIMAMAIGVILLLIVVVRSLFLQWKKSKKPPEEQ